MIGYTLDLAGGMSRPAWGAAFLGVAILILLALVAFWLIGRANLPEIAVKIERIMSRTNGRAFSLRSR